MRGNIIKAIQSNVLFLLILPFLILGVFYKSYLYVLNKEDNIIDKYVCIVLIIIIIIYWILRNIDGFEFLRP
jgi:hypothetical protein